jgi:hypothetical protein
MEKDDRPGVRRVLRQAQLYGYLIARHRRLFYPGGHHGLQIRWNGPGHQAMGWRLCVGGGASRLDNHKGQSSFTRGADRINCAQSERVESAAIRSSGHLLRLTENDAMRRRSCQFDNIASGNLM